MLSFLPLRKKQHLLPQMNSGRGLCPVQLLQINYLPVKLYPIACFAHACTLQILSYVNVIKLKGRRKSLARLSSVWIACYHIKPILINQGILKKYIYFNVCSLQSDPKISFRSSVNGYSVLSKNLTKGFGMQRYAGRFSVLDNFALSERWLR